MRDEREIRTHRDNLRRFMLLTDCWCHNCLAIAAMRDALSWALGDVVESMGRHVEGIAKQAAERV